MRGMLDKETGHPLSGEWLDEMERQFEALIRHREQLAYERGLQHQAGVDTPGHYLDSMEKSHRELRAEAVVQELERLYLRGHTAERASVPRVKEPGVYDQPDWVAIQTPIFYCFKSTIVDRIAQLTQAESKEDKVE